MGATVRQGDVIGYVGNTGNSFGAHLHFEVRINGVATDPLSYL
jgi:murein DD-endopeptidase MepM/ murein hydrolase activator NlpD